MLNCLYFILRIEEQEIFLHSICRENFFEKNFGIFHFYSYLCSAVPVRPSPRLFDAGDDPGFFVFAKVHKYFDSDNKKAFFLCFFCYLPHPQTFSPKSLHLSEEKSIFSGWRKYLLELEKVSFRVLESNFSIVVTRLGSSAEPSQQVCRLQSAPLPSLVGIPCCRTTITLLVVQL